MAIVSNFDHLSDGQTDGLTASELLDTNWQTTAAVGLTVATGGVAGVVMLSALPAQTLLAGGTVAALAYAGKRRADGQSAIPFMGNKDDKKSSTKSEDKSSDSDSKTEVQPSAA